MRRLRRIWRACFGREPSYLDGYAISLAITLRGLSWEEALDERVRVNTASRLAWYRGD